MRIGSGIAFPMIAGGFIGYKVGQSTGLGVVELIIGLILGLVAPMSMYKTFSEQKIKFPFPQLVFPCFRLNPEEIKH